MRTAAAQTFAEVGDEPPPCDVDFMDDLQSEVHNQKEAEVVKNFNLGDEDGNGDPDCDSENEQYDDDNIIDSEEDED